MDLTRFRTCTFLFYIFCVNFWGFVSQPLFLCLSARRLMMWYVCEVFENRLYLLFNSSWESHSSGGGGRRKNLNLRAHLENFSEVGMHEGDATNKHSGVLECVSCGWRGGFPARTFVILFQGRSLHFRRCRGAPAPLPPPGCLPYRPPFHRPSLAAAPSPASKPQINGQQNHAPLTVPCGADPPRVIIKVKE